MKFEWKDEYLIGDTIIDNEHQRLFELANVVTHSSTNDELINGVMRLYRHIREHFSDEEKLMKEHDYPDYERHLGEHNQMLSLLTSKSDAIREGKWNKNQIAEFMTLWISHITTNDQPFRHYLTSQNNPS